MGASQGLNILLNLFFGVTVNAAMGIANQVQSAVYSFVGNFQTAFNPQIVKSYASGDRGYFIDLIMRTSKYSYYLLYVISLPLYLCCEEVLALWLGEVPTYTVSFCRWMILFSLLECHSGTALDLCTGYWKYPQLSNPDGHNDLIKRTHKLFVF